MRFGVIAGAKCVGEIADGSPCRMMISYLVEDEEESN